MPLASDVVDRLFARLAVCYGSAWSGKWDGLPVEAVKADWAEQLEGISLGALRYGIDHLPDFPPTSRQFRNLCIDRPDDSTPKLPPPRGPIPQRIAAELAKIAEAQRDRPAKAWAHALKDREKAGERLALAQRMAWREALGLPPTSVIPTWEQTPEEFAAGSPNPGVRA